MISGLHAIIFCDDPERARAFFSEVLAVHPEPGSQGRHELFLMCHDISQTMRELKAKHVEFVGSVSEQRWGKVARFKVPGAGEISLYQPSHPSPLSEFPPAGRRP